MLHTHRLSLALSALVLAAALAADGTPVASAAEPQPTSQSTLTQTSPPAQPTPGPTAQPPSNAPAQPTATRPPVPAARPTVAPSPPPFEPYWVQNVRTTQLWSGADQQAAAFGTVPQWSYFQVMEPQRGSRLHVLDARTSNYAWLDAADVGPSGPPPEPTSPAGEPEPGTPQRWWVVNHAATPLWSGPGEDALRLGDVRPWNYFEVLEPQVGARFHVRDPRGGGEAYLDASALGPVGAPGALGNPSQWWGYVGVDAVNVRAEPTRMSEVRGELPATTPVLVRRWVEGDEVVKNDTTWAELDEGAFIWANLLRQVKLEAPPPPPRMLDAKRWIDVNLTFQVVTAYEGDNVAYWARTSTGGPGWETPTGIFPIKRRVEKEIMDSDTLLGKDAERADYRVEDVRWTQYFTNEGHALHENYWKAPDTFGVPSSHGCAGLMAQDAEWFWRWASVGTPVFVH